MMKQRFKCSTQFFDGPIKGFETKMKELFTAIGMQHHCIDDVMLERACDQKFIEGLHVADACAVHRRQCQHLVTRQALRLSSLLTSNTKHSVESGGVVDTFDVLRAKPVEASLGRIDGPVIGATYTTYGEGVSLSASVCKPASASKCR